MRPGEDDVHAPAVAFDEIKAHQLALAGGDGFIEEALAQFWNVLVGDMSLVGPRPERPIFVSQFRSRVLHYMLRHKVKAGITGWAQVNGWRGDTSLDERIRCDLHYIRNWSYLLDMKILLLTVWKGFVNKNAY